MSYSMENSHNITSHNTTPPHHEHHRPSEGDFPTNGLILLLGANPYEGPRSQSWKSRLTHQEGKMQALGDNPNVYFVDLYQRIPSSDGELVPVDHPRCFNIDFNDTAAMIKAFDGLQGEFAEIHFDFSTQKFFSLWSFAILHTLLKPSGVVVCQKFPSVSVISFDALRYSMYEIFLTMSGEYFNQMGLLGFEDGLGAPLELLEEAPDPEEWLVLRKKDGRPIVDIEKAAHFKQLGVCISETEFAQVSEQRAMEIYEETDFFDGLPRDLDDGYRKNEWYFRRWYFQRVVEWVNTPWDVQKDRPMTTIQRALHFAQVPSHSLHKVSDAECSQHCLQRAMDLFEKADFFRATCRVRKDPKVDEHEEQERSLDWNLIWAYKELQLLFEARAQWSWRLRSHRLSASGGGNARRADKEMQKLHEAQATSSEKLRSVALRSGALRSEALHRHRLVAKGVDVDVAVVGQTHGQGGVQTQGKKGVQVMRRPDAMNPTLAESSPSKFGVCGFFNSQGKKCNRTVTGCPYAHRGPNNAREEAMLNAFFEKNPRLRRK